MYLITTKKDDNEIIVVGVCRYLKTAIKHINSFSKELRTQGYYVDELQIKGSYGAIITNELTEEKTSIVAKKIRLIS